MELSTHTRLMELFPEEAICECLKPIFIAVIKGLNTRNTVHIRIPNKFDALFYSLNPVDQKKTFFYLHFIFFHLRNHSNYRLGYTTEKISIQKLDLLVGEYRISSVRVVITNNTKIREYPYK